MRILLIGANGQLGSDLKKTLDGKELICPALSDLDIAQFEETKNYIIQENPNLIINTAAFHQVDNCEADPNKSFLINTLSVKNLADICEKKDIPLVHYSTDYVFGLNKERKIPRRSVFDMRAVGGV